MFKREGERDFMDKFEVVYNRIVEAGSKEEAYKVAEDSCPEGLKVLEINRWE